MMLFYAALLGACFGSFLNVVIYRLPLERSIVTPGSFCPRCNTPIHWYDNIPLVSYIILRGKCRKCGEKISLRYPAIEAAAMVITVLIYRFFGLSFQSGIILVLSLWMFAVAIIDFEHMIIPDELSLGGAILGLGLSFLPGGVVPLDAFIGAASGAASLWLVRWVHMKVSGIEGMGLGDVKLAGMIGAFVGWRALAPVFFASAVSGLIVGGAAILAQRKGARTPIPFGTFLAIGTVVYAIGEPFWVRLLQGMVFVR